MIVLRSAIFNLFFFILTFALTLSATLVRPLGSRWVLLFGMLWSRALLVGARLLCGIRLEVQGLEYIPPGGCLIASRHQSAFDTFVWLSLLPRCCYVLEYELLRIPLFGGLVRSAGMIAINRKAGGAALRALLREGEQAAARQQQIVIFPEGTRSAHGQPHPLQPGIVALAAKTRLPVVPVATDLGLMLGTKSFSEAPWHDPYHD